VSSECLTHAQWSATSSMSSGSGLQPALSSALIAATSSSVKIDGRGPREAAGWLRACLGVVVVGCSAPSHGCSASVSSASWQSWGSKLSTMTGIAAPSLLFHVPGMRGSVVRDPVRALSTFNPSASAAAWSASAWRCHSFEGIALSSIQWTWSPWPVRTLAVGVGHLCGGDEVL